MFIGEEGLQPFGKAARTERVDGGPLMNGGGRLIRDVFQRKCRGTALSNNLGNESVMTADNNINAHQVSK